jgi:hypothetical protein
MAVVAKMSLTKTFRRLGLAGITAALVSGLLFFLACNGSNGGPLAQCIQHSDLDQHVHTLLILTVDGQPQNIPANLGITSDCMRPLHTHDEGGLIHIESTRPHVFVLGDFFTIWEEWSEEDPLDGLWVERLQVNGTPFEGDYQEVPLMDREIFMLETVSSP